MATLLYRLGKTAYRRWPLFLAAWLIALVGVGAVAATFSKPMSSAFTLPGIASMQAAELQQELFPNTQSVDAPSATVVVAAPVGSTLTEKPSADAISTLVGDLNANAHIVGPVVGPVEASDGMQQAAMQAVDQAEAAARTSGQEFDRNQALAAADAQLSAALPLSQDGRVGTIAFAFDVPQVADVTPEMRAAVNDAIDAARAAGLTVEVSGSGMQTQEVGGATGELIGIAIALIILALTFGS